MEPEYVGSGSGPDGVKTGGMWKQMSYEEKMAAIMEEVKVLRQLPRKSNYASHRLRLLDKIQQLLRIQRTTSQDKELELLLSGLHL